MQRIVSSRRLRRAASIIIPLALTLFSALLPKGLRASDTASIALTGHIPPLALTSRMIGHASRADTLRLALTLPLRDQLALTELLQHLYKPGDPLYGQYLSSQAFADRFGPSQADYNAIIEFVHSAGLSVVQTH